MAEIRFSKDERGLSKQFTIAQTDTPTTGQDGSGQPQLDADFEVKFEDAKSQFLKGVKADLTKPAVVAAWKPLIDARARDVVDAGTKEATQWINEVLAEMDQQIIAGYEWEQIGPGVAAFALNDCLQELLQKHFKAARPDEMDFAEIAIEEELRKVRDDPYGINSNQVTYSYGGTWCIKDRPAYTNKGTKTTTHLCPLLFRDHVFSEYPGKNETLAHTLIHESLHRIEGWSDQAYEEAQYPGLSSATALINPDSFASFVRDAFTCPKQTTLKDVFFGFNSATLNAEAKRVLNQDSAWLMANSAVKVRLEGHADERGGASYNLALGDRRAAAVRDYLGATAGLSSARLMTKSWGDTRPFAPGHGEWAWRFNRRVHFVVVGN